MTSTAAPLPAATPRRRGALAPGSRGFVATLAACMACTALAIDTALPAFWPFVVLLAAVLFFLPMVVPNLNAAAMRPMGPVAGTAAALFGMVPGVLGAVVGGLIDRRFDGTIRPIAVAFVVLSLIAFTAWRRTVGLHATNSRPVSRSV